MRTPKEKYCDSDLTPLGFVGGGCAGCIVNPGSELMPSGLSRNDAKKIRQHMRVYHYSF